MKYFFVLALSLLLSLSPGVIEAQPPDTAPAGPEMTEKEKTEIRAFTKEFLGRLRRTRDVRPLVPRYFAKDFETFVCHFMLTEASGGVNVRLPGPEHRKRAVIALLNQVALFTPYTVLTLDFEKELPPRLRRQWERFEAKLDAADGDNAAMFNKQLLTQIESLNRAMAAHLRSHPIERTNKYRTQLKKREAIDEYNYSIQEDVPGRDSDEPAAEWIRSQPDARTYMVGTPHGFAVGILRSGNQYKVLYLFPWPISYDPMLN